MFPALNFNFARKTAYSSKKHICLQCDLNWAMHGDSTKTTCYEIYQKCCNDLKVLKKWVFEKF